MGNVLGRRFKVVSFGESHGKCVGVVIDGCPAGLPLSEEDVQKELDLRRPIQLPFATKRAEPDKVEVLAGVLNGFTTGAPICMLVWNKDVDSGPYEEFKVKPRPGHADFTRHVKYGGFGDWRGGGRFSARVTASFVMAGAVAKKLLRISFGTEVVAYAIEIGGVRAKDVPFDDALRLRYSNSVRCPDLDTAPLMQKKLEEAIKDGDSVGGIVECVAQPLPVGLGEPIFDSLDSELSKAMLSIPAVKGVEFGLGFESSRKRGSENNDPFAFINGKVVTTTNRAGGVLGGISTGMPLVLRVAFKPTSSIAKPQKTVRLDTFEEAEISVKGRHDPCVVPRAVPIVESMVAIVLVDLAIEGGLIQPVVLKEG